MKRGRPRSSLPPALRGICRGCDPFTYNAIVFAVQCYIIDVCGGRSWPSIGGVHQEYLSFCVREWYCFGRRVDGFKYDQPWVAGHGETES